MSEQNYVVTGMTCQHCVAAVTQEVGQVTGVTSVAVDLDNGLVTVGSTTGVDPEAVAAAVDEAGYELVGQSY